MKNKGNNDNNKVEIKNKIPLTHPKIKLITNKANERYKQIVKIFSRILSILF
jgi:hypothetical protein